jgi:ABC-type uncharacterized transport system involved in gliding motility auxiliary subunit
VALMRERLEAYGPYFAGIGVFLILAALLLPAYIRQTSVQVPPWLPWALGIAGAVLVLAWPTLRPDDLRAALGARQTRYGGNALILALSVIGALVIVNFLGTRRYTLWDLTSNKQFSVSRQTMQILDDLDHGTEKVKLTAVVASNQGSTVADLTKLVDKYKARTGKIDFELIDPQVDRLKLLGLAERIGMKDAPPNRAVVAEMGKRHEIVYTGFDEQALTEAVLKVMRDRKTKVAFTTGHDEFDPEGSGDRSYASVKAELEREGYVVQKVNLASITQTLTADTFDAIVVAGPKKPFLPQEARALAGYVAGGGSAMLMLDPTIDAGLEAVLDPWAIRPAEDLVLQPNFLGSLSSSVVAQGDDYQFHTITKDMTALTTIFPAARSLGTGTPVTSTLSATAIVQVGKRGEWGETDFANLQGGNATKDPTDTQPPLTLALAGEDSARATTNDGEAATAPKTGFGRLVVFGSSALAADDLLQQFPPGSVANFDLFLNATNWLAQDEALITIRPTQADDRPIKRPSNPLLLILATAVLAPLAVLGVGTWIYWRRR